MRVIKKVFVPHASTAPRLSEASTKTSKWKKVKLAAADHEQRWITPLFPENLSGHSACEHVWYTLDPFINIAILPDHILMLARTSLAVTFRLGVSQKDPAHNTFLN